MSNQYTNYKMTKTADSQRCELILLQLVAQRELTEKELKVFEVMINLNEQNFGSLTALEMMQKHQLALNYIISNSQ